MENVSVSKWMLMGGGLVLLVSTFLDWRSRGSFGVNGWETESFGLQGIFIALIGLAIGGGVAAMTFGNVSLPDRILSLNHDQLHLSLGGAAFILNFGQQFASDAGIGTTLGWLAAAVIIAASVMDMRSADGGGAPTQF